MIELKKYIKLSFISVLFLIFSLLQSCEDFEDDRRILIKGNIANVNSIDQDPIQVLASFENRISDFTSEQDLIGSTIVRQNGTFDMTIPVPRSEPVFLAVQHNFENENFQLSIEIPNGVFSGSGFNNLIDLQDVEVQQNSRLVLNFINSSSSTLSVNWNLSYLIFPCELLYDGESLIPANDFCGEPVFESGEFSEDSFIIQRDVLRNSTAILEYQVEDQVPQLLEITLNDSLNEIDVVY